MKRLLLGRQLRRVQRLCWLGFLAAACHRSAPPPASSTPAPASSTPAPASSTPAPASSTPAPASSTPAPASSAPAPASSTSPPASADPSYLVIYRPGPRWPGGDALPPELRAHFQYLLGLHQAGTLQMAGPFGGEPGGAAVLHARDDAAARAVLEADPAVTAQVFDFELRRWSPVDWAAHARRAGASSGSR